MAAVAAAAALEEINVRVGQLDAQRKGLDEREVGDGVCGAGDGQHCSGMVKRECASG